MPLLLGEEIRTDYLAIPVVGLSGRGTVPFALYLATAANKWVLYQPADNVFQHDCEARLRAEGIDTLFIQSQDRQAYARRVENSLQRILKDPKVLLARRAEILHEVALQVAEDLFAGEVERTTIERARKVMAGTAGLVMRDRRAFKAIRRVLDTRDDLSEHSLTVAMLAVGLAHEVIGRDANMLMNAGLAGLLHDIGHFDGPPGSHDRSDPEHPQKGYRILVSHGMPEEVSQAALCHHERYDGSGFPQGLRGNKVPLLARIVGLADAFHRVYTEQQETGVAGSFETLRLLAQDHRGSFDPRMTGDFVQLFAY